MNRILVIVFMLVFSFGAYAQKDATEKLVKSLNETEVVKDILKANDDFYDKVQNGIDGSKLSFEGYYKYTENYLNVFFKYKKLWKVLTADLKSAKELKAMKASPDTYKTKYKTLFDDYLWYQQFMFYKLWLDTKGYTNTKPVIHQLNTSSFTKYIDAINKANISKIDTNLVNSLFTQPLKFKSFSDLVSGPPDKTKKENANILLKDFKGSIKLDSLVKSKGKKDNNETKSLTFKLKDKDNKEIVTGDPNRQAGRNKDSVYISKSDYFEAGSIQTDTTFFQIKLSTHVYVYIFYQNTLDNSAVSLYPYAKKVAETYGIVDPRSYDHLVNEKTFFVDIPVKGQFMNVPSKNILKQPATENYIFSKGDRQEIAVIVANYPLNQLELNADIQGTSGELQQRILKAMDKSDINISDNSKVKIEDSQISFQGDNSKKNAIPLFLVVKKSK